MTSQPRYAAFVGIDWADQQHACCLVERDSSKREASVVAQTAESLDAWAADLRKRFGDRPVAVCLEQSRGALAYALMKYEFLVLFPLNPKQLAKYREALAPCGAKDDPSDAELLCSFLKEHHGRLRAWRPDDAITRQLRLLSEMRRKWVDQRTALGNQLIGQLKEVYPLALEFAGKHIYAAGVLALLSKFPSQRELQRASPRQLARLLPKPRRTVEESRLSTSRDPRVAAVREAKPLVTDAAILAASRLCIQHLVELLVRLNRTIAEYDREIAALIIKHPDAKLFGSLPGAGEALVPRLIAAFGTDRDRYESALHLAQFSGVAPITVRSGKTCLVRRRFFCPKHLRQTFHEFARCSLRGSAWAEAYCRMMRAKGHGFHSAVRALAFKWIRIVFRCWKERKPYDEAEYLQRLRQKNSPLLPYLSPKLPTPEN